MKLEQFMRSIYLGDRACKTVVMDGRNRELKIQIDCISRVRSEKWDYYTEEDLVDGFLVFEDVERVVFEPSGWVPNDWIEWISVAEDARQPGMNNFVIKAGSVDKQGAEVEIQLSILAGGVVLEDSKGVRIRE